jgi:uncharacterized protein (TIGR02246 family)
MTRPRSIVAALSAFLFLAAAAVALAEPAIETVDAAWAKAMKAGDIEAIVACYAPDAVLWAPDEQKAVGTVEIRQVFANLLAAFEVMDAQTMNVHYKTTGDVSLAWGQFHITLMPKSGGDPITMTGRFTEVAEKRNGKWVYTVDHASADPAPKPMPGSGH